MIVEYVRYEMTEYTPEKLIEAYGAAIEHLRAAPQCLGYDLTRCVEEPLSLILRIQWTSREDHLEGFRKGPHFPQFLALIRPFVGEITEMRHYAHLDIQWQR
ncbi:antibiotic biosynthesis monooxygenase (plasmid) [Rhizobium sp. 32-5/1]|uniref:putative quinol monooxygenase n=1 Tax=Rhizobium sp. 32-5/1 TaxID=3019602 RepID=UPI00240CFBB7|nr:antibiotic biosynthesis monooxygenase family protein [Rhizobium sp. 32-5/1]WEZ85611.1 antibiotic biosynthesis monooxygenase [Rhizobium sp. 32-5/1]